MSNAIPSFVDLLDTWSYHYPLPSQWAAEIPLPSGISRSLESKIQELEHPEWGLNPAFEELTKYEVLKKDTIHCFFIDGINQIGETCTVASTNIGDGGNINGGLIPGIYSNGRADFASRELTIRFRETAHSFADFVIRPWIILAAHLGRIADQNNQIKTDITVYNYGKSQSSGGGPVIRKIYRYYGCVPAKVDTQELSYKEDSSIIIYNTGWHFDRYSISPAVATSSVSTPVRASSAELVSEEVAEYSPGARATQARSFERTPQESAQSATSVRDLRSELSREPGGEWLRNVRPTGG
jgi:hypothetical protein